MDILKELHLDDYEDTFYNTNCSLVINIFEKLVKNFYKLNENDLSVNSKEKLEDIEKEFCELLINDYISYRCDYVLISLPTSLIDVFHGFFKKIRNLYEVKNGKIKLIKEPELWLY